ncbi:MAG: hypothetical protein RIT24_2645 [Planctomycetota bacterium]|jgi:miniconductance mechanosensitive channel
MLVRACSLCFVACILCSQSLASAAPRGAMKEASSAVVEGRTVSGESPSQGTRADEPVGPQDAESPTEAAVKRNPTATERAALDLVESIQDTDFGAWLKQHQFAWNAIAIGVLLALGFALKLILMRVLGPLLARALERANKKRLSDAIAASKVIGPISAIAPLLLIARVLSLLGDATAINPLVAFNASNLCIAYAIVKGIGIASSLMKTVDDVYSSRPEVNRPEALRGYRQVAMVVIGLAGGISAAAIAVGKSPVVFLAALGAAGAIIGVVFKDTLFSLVANLLLTANDSIRVGDWVELKAHGIDGRIAEIKTTAVRVQNADGTVHTVPIARFVQEPYMNYRSKHGSPGRRVRRALRVDVRSVRALSQDDLAALAKVASLAGALARARTAAGDAPITNLCVFRSFAERMLASNASVDPTLPIVISQQEAGVAGVPVEVLCFIKPDAAPDLASVEGALLDRLTLALPAFALRAYQQGSDYGANPPATGWLAAGDLAAAGA